MAANIHFVDQTPEIESYYVIDSVPDASESPSRPQSRSSLTTALASSSRTASPPNDGQASSITNPSALVRSSETLAIQESESISRRGEANDETPTFTSQSSDTQAIDHHWPTALIDSNGGGVQSISSRKTHSEASFPDIHVSPANLLRPEGDCLRDSAAAALRSAASSPLSPSVWKERFFWPNAYTTTQCLCLMRFFIREIAPWVSLPPAASTNSGAHIFQARHLLSCAAIYPRITRASQTMPTTTERCFHSRGQTTR